MSRPALGEVTNLAAAGAGKASKTAASSAANKFEKLTQLQHILKRPDTYTGSVLKRSETMWVFDVALNTMMKKEVTYVPALLKIFDEILVNAADNKQRDPRMNKLKATIDADTNTISVWNNGSAVPVVWHDKEDMYVPELIFGNLLTSSNYNDDEEKVTGGRNGYGAKLTNIFSTEFTVECNDTKHGKHYKQTFRNNMGDKDEPVIGKPKKGGDFTCITFRPDLERFKMTHLDDDIIGLMTKRVYDMAAVTDRTLTVYLNGKSLGIKDLKSYAAMFIKPDGEETPPLLYKRLGDRWEVCVSLSDGEFDHMSFVNSIATTSGGPHVKYIESQITAAIVPAANKKTRATVTARQVKNHLRLFVNCLIVNPSFDSQTKEKLTTLTKDFGSSVSLVTDHKDFLKAITKCGILERVLDSANQRQMKDLAKASGGKKLKVLGIPKLDDANFAASSKAQKCTLILTEGDSAKTLAVAGLSVVGRDYYGVFPLKGKPLNVREAQHKQIIANAEISNIVKIMGLKFGQKYTSTKGLRYGHLMIMADQDHDGSHIKGLIINMFHHFWPSLLEIDGFLGEFITPIVKVTKGSRSLSFYTVPEYDAWKEDNNGGKGWHAKYYKGLGTSSAKEAKQYFKDLKAHHIKFAYTGPADGDAIDLAFAKKRADERKAWLLALEEGTYVDFNVSRMPYSTFVNKELILFSQADVIRSIPSAIDGMKPAQRKVLFACFKRKLKKEIKVAQLAGYVSEHTAYHHGEQSLAMTIVGMAQDYCGSNNINLLFPSGQFGTRLMGGKDAASPRYIFTRLAAIARLVFREEDDAVLSYLQEDGDTVEPEWYMPVIPMVLVNGADGIGTGWSSSVPNYNPRDIVAYLRAKLTDTPAEDMPRLLPWYRNFTGNVHAKDSTHFITQGRFHLNEATETLTITELPIRKWTQDYKQYLETLMLEPEAKKTTGKDTRTAAEKRAAKAKEKEAKEAFTPLFSSLRENHTDVTVDFTLKVTPAGMAAMETPAKAKKLLKIDVPFATTNMHLFDKKCRIHKYESPEEVIESFFSLRLDFYGRRKEHLIQQLTADWTKLDNKVRFILMVVNGELVVSKKKKKALMKELQALGFDTIVAPKKKAKREEEEEEEEDDAGADDLSKGYNYLLSMPLWSLTLEKVEKLRGERDAKGAALEELKGTTLPQMWLHDLEDLEQGLSDVDKVHAKALKGRPAATMTIGPAYKRANPATVLEETKADATVEAKTESTEDDTSPPPIAGAGAGVDPDSDFEIDVAPLAARMNKAATATKKRPPPTAASPKAVTYNEDSLSPVAEVPKKRGRAPKAAPKAKKPAVRKLRATSPVVAVLDTSASDFDPADFDVVAPKPTRARRTAATTAQYVFDSDDDVANGSDGDSVFNLCSDSDFEVEAPKAKRGGKRKVAPPLSSEGPSPSPVAKRAPKRAPKKAVAKPPPPESDEEAEFELSVEEPVVKKAPAKKAPAKKASAKKPAAKKAATKKAASESEFELSDEEPVVKKAPAKKAPAKKPAAKKAPAKKAPAKKAPAKKAPAKKKAVPASDSESELDVSIDVPATPVARPSRRAAAAKPVTYNFGDSEGEADSEESAFSVADEESDFEL